jgi:lipopolysaccharide export system permease protein
MNGFTKYVLRQLLVGMILVTAGLTCIIWLSQSLRFIEMIVNRGLSAGMFVYLTMLLLPNFLVLVLPIALFTVVTFTYAKLISDRELMVMRAAGLSQFALAKPALILAFGVVAFGYWLNLSLLPQTYAKFRELQWDIRYSYSHILLREGAFNAIADGITVYVRQRTSDGKLLGILVHDQREKDHPFTMMAAEGAMVQTDQGARVVMFNGNRQAVDSETNKLSILYFDRYVFDLTPMQNVHDDRFREPRERPLHELFRIAEVEPTMERKEFGKFIVEGHKRLLSPLSSLAYTLVALACLISGGFSRRAQTRQVCTAIAIMVALQSGTLGLENVVAKDLRMTGAMYALAIAPILVSYYFMVRLQWRRRPAQQPSTA